MHLLLSRQNVSAPAHGGAVPSQYPDMKSQKNFHGMRAAHSRIAPRSGNAPCRRLPKPDRRPRRTGSTGPDNVAANRLKNRQEQPVPSPLRLAPMTAMQTRRPKPLRSGTVADRLKQAKSV